MRKGFFITEKASEDLLVFETRDITMPDGSTRPFTGMKLMWKSYDFIVHEYRQFKPQEVTALTALMSKEMKLPFDRCFPSLVAYVHQEIRKAWRG